MKNKKKNAGSDLKENQKRLFLRMKSPSAFGAVRRFDSTSFMNVPPEMARRDAAFERLFNFFQTCDLKHETPAERRRIYNLILTHLNLIEMRTEFILNADLVEKRHLEKVESLTFVRLLRDYFRILNCSVELSADEILGGKLKSLAPEPPGKSPAAGVGAGAVPETGTEEQEFLLVETVRSVIARIQPQLTAAREAWCKLFSKGDSERYERSYAFYLEHYKDLKNF